MFADDTKIYGKVNSQEDIDIIQKDLENLQVWSEEWLLKFNADKCKTVHMGTGNTQNDYHMGQTTLETTEIEKDLGVFLTSDCKVSTQCTKAAAKAMNCLRVIKRSFQFPVYRH